jgi:hypothetical protein
MAKKQTAVKRLYPKLHESIKHLLTLLKTAFLSESLYDWRFTVNQFVLTTSPLRPTTRIIIFQLNTCGYSPYVTSTLARGLVCRLQLLLVLDSAVILGSKCRGNHERILLSLIRESPILEGHVSFPQEQGGPVIPPRHCVPFSSPPKTRRATVEAFQPTSTRDPQT